MRRRQFMTLLGGAAVAWPRVARAQQSDRMRRIGVLMPFAANDPDALLLLAAFRQQLQDLGWTEGRNVRFDYRWGAGDAGLYRTYAAELLALAPDLLFCTAGSVLGALQGATRTVPIVFAQVIDPVSAGRIASLARPGGNTTGFAGAEFGISAKWLELLKQIAPRVTRVAAIRDPTTAGGLGFLGAMLSVAPSLGLEVSPVDVRDTGEMDHAVTAFARTPNGGLIVGNGTWAAIHREQITTLAAQHRLPAVYGARAFVTGGGLISYSAVTIDYYRLAAGYVDRIFKGEKPADLPVQAPTRFETVLNLKTAKALGLDVPDAVLTRADEVIE